MRPSINSYMASVFADFHKKAEKERFNPWTSRSKDWFYSKLRRFQGAKPDRILKDDRLKKKNRPIMGRVFMFKYDPKTKDAMPYYDTFPMIILLEHRRGGFVGLNLHYLPPLLRARFFDLLMDDELNNEKMDHTTKFRITYAKLKAASRYKLFKPCYKRYLTDHVRSHFVEVTPEDYEMAIFLPTDQFVKEKRAKIWSDSRKMINKR